MTSARDSGLDPSSTAIADRPEVHATEQIQQGEISANPYIPERKSFKNSFKDNSRLLLTGVGIVAVLLIFVLGHIPHSSRPEIKNSSQKSRTNEGVASIGSLTPIIEPIQQSAQEANDERIGPQEIARTASIREKTSAATTLGDIRPFDNPGSWEPSPFRVDVQEPGAPAHNASLMEEKIDAKSDRDLLEKASLVFVRNATSVVNNFRALTSDSDETHGIGLPPGTRLRARLEVAVSTAVPMPVVAVVEYNYERNGRIVVPAGAKAVGHLDAADRSGYVSLRFDSLLLPDGSTTRLEATAVDLNFRPLRGSVQGKNKGKNIMVRSLAGLGEVAATVAGHGSLNQPLNEADLLRERLSGNIGQASDEEIAKLALTERLDISVPAGTHIYIVLQKSARSPVEERPSLNSELSTAKQPTIEELRQLLQLQRELNQNSATADLRR